MILLMILFMTGMFICIIMGVLVATIEQRHTKEYLRSRDQFGLTAMGASVSFFIIFVTVLMVIVSCNP